MKVLEKVQRLVETGGQQKSAPGRKFAHEKLENRGLRLAMIQIRLDHVELIQIGQQQCRDIAHELLPCAEYGAEYLPNLT